MAAIISPNLGEVIMKSTLLTSLSMDIFHLHKWDFLTGLIALILLRTFYRLYFHPLARIPGPKLTAATSLYEFYHDVICGGRFTFQIEKMHQQYGPIVRINPREVHIIDPSFYQEIYAPSSRRRDRDAPFVKAFGLPYASVATVKHDVHRYRRSLLNDFFSRRSVLALSPMIGERIEKLMTRFTELYKEGRAVDLCDAFGALTSDIVTFYCYGKSWGFLEDPDFRSDIRTAGNDFAAFCHINRFFPFLPNLLRRVPPYITSAFIPGKSALFEFQRSILQHFSAIVAGKTIALTGDHNIINRLTSKDIPPEERTINRLQDEGVTLVVAGSETTLRSLAFAAYYIFQDSAIRDKLRAELKEVLPTTTSTTTLPVLEKLPYLTGVVNEALRLSDVTVSRLPRVAPDETLQYHEHAIPPGTPVSTSNYFVHRNPKIFPDPCKFDPERWIRAAEEGVPLQKYLVAFTKGSRMCVCINLAIMELYLTIAYYVRRFEFEILNTDPENIRVTRDLVVGLPETGVLEIHAKVTGIVQE
ncbi:cytochrome P450 [Penicillium capsulatum]|uniref:Cytochrome P450 n=1 Tax=Penicillium capsulatum TaxID=69766 RepID=A0A9W9HSL6_9EURO|nr:cytochrome P450 [Penicillium capsulatum]KAJ6105809.1 cytochrome P450 [Penicillium capsulatum]